MKSDMTNFMEDIKSQFIQIIVTICDNNRRMTVSCHH